MDTQERDFPFLDNCMEGITFCLQAEHTSDSKPQPEGSNSFAKGNVQTILSPFIFWCSHLLLKHFSR